MQRFFTRLSVFSGGWTLEAAEAVCQEPDAVHYLQLLRERSLIIAEEVHAQTGEAGNEDEDRVRFRMLETLWEFAWEKLEATSSEEENQTLRLKHAQWYLARLQCQDFAVSEVENFRAAHNWVQAQPDQNNLYFQLVLKLSLFWRTKGWWCEGLSCLEAALTREKTDFPDLYAQLMCSTASLCRMLKDYPASMRYYQQALVLLKEAGNLRGMTDALNGMGCTALDQQQHEEAKRCLHQGLLLAVQIHDDPMAASIHGNLGYVAKHQKDWQTAQEHLQQCLAIHQAQNASLAWPLQNLGELAYAQEQWTEARDFFTASLEKYRQIDETYRIAEVLEQLSEVLRRCGDPEAAARCFEESQILYRHLRGS